MYCDDIRELMSAHVDGVLDPAGEKRLTEHLAICGACRLELAALQRLVEQLRMLPPVTPPPDLTAKIHARVRLSRRAKILAFLSLPQTRVVLAASLLIIVTTLGIRQMYATRPQPVTTPLIAEQKQAVASMASMPQEATCRMPAAVACAEPAVVHPSVVMRPTIRKKAALDVDGLVAADDAKEPAKSAKYEMDAVAAPAAAPPAAADVEMLKELTKAKKCQMEDAAAAADARVQAPGVPRPMQSKARLSRSLPSESARVALGVDPLRREVSVGYTFHTERLAEAVAIVNRYAGAHAEGRQIAGEAKFQDKVVVPQSPVIMEVSLPSEQVAAVVAELQKSGAVAVNQPEPQPERAAATVQTAAGSMVSLKAAAPATNILVRFTFLPVER